MTICRRKAAQAAESAQCPTERRMGRAYNRRTRRAVRRTSRPTQQCAPCCLCTCRIGYAHWDVLPSSQQRPASCPWKTECACRNADKGTPCGCTGGQTPSEYASAQERGEGVLSSRGQTSRLVRQRAGNTDQGCTDQILDLRSWIGPLTDDMCKMMNANPTMKNHFRAIHETMNKYNIPHNYRVLMQAITDPDGTLFGPGPDDAY